MHNEPNQADAGQSGGPQFREAFDRLVVGYPRVWLSCRQFEFRGVAFEHFQVFTAAIEHARRRVRTALACGVPFAGTRVTWFG